MISGLRDVAGGVGGSLGGVVDLTFYGCDVLCNVGSGWMVGG